MYVARILYPVEVLGPGKRVGIWFSGCSHRCKGCCNPELWEMDKNYATTLSVVMDLIEKIASKHPVDGFTITGGDPLHQKEDFLSLTEQCKKISTDILLYTGYLLEEIPKQYLNNVSVLIDGKYQEAKNNNCLLRGSSNQKIHFLQTEAKEKYELYLSETENQVQLFQTTNGYVSVGIHRPHFQEDVEFLLREKGVE